MNAATLDVIAGLNPEEEQQPEKRIEIVRSPELERILKGFEQVLASSDKASIDKMLARLTPKQIPAAVITQASVALAAYSKHKEFPERAGYYLTALVNRSTDEEHTFYTHGHSQPPEIIGYELRKKLTVHGLTGDFTGVNNRGELILAGNTGICLGMENVGKIILNGNAGNDIGHCNRGYIKINGDTGDDFGISNHGTICLNGTYKSLARELGTGKIYQNGVLIVDKGRRLV